MKDSQIIELYLQRNQQAIAESEDKYGAYCYQVAKHILNNADDCEECVNDTWLNAWNAIPPHRPNVLKLFFAKITRNLSYNRYKSLSAKKRGGCETTAVLEELKECLADPCCVDDMVDTHELETHINSFVKQLPAREQTLFIQRYFFTKPISMIAEQLGLSENHVAVLMNRTRKKLKKYLAKEGYFYE